jgi:hypothetical protein
VAGEYWISFPAGTWQKPPTVIVSALNGGATVHTNFTIKTYFDGSAVLYVTTLDPNYHGVPNYDFCFIAMEPN